MSRAIKLSWISTKSSSSVKVLRHLNHSRNEFGRVDWHRCFGRSSIFISGLLTNVGAENNINYIGKFNSSSCLVVVRYQTLSQKPFFDFPSYIRWFTLKNLKLNQIIWYRKTTNEKALVAWIIYEDKMLKNCWLWMWWVADARRAMLLLPKDSRIKIKRKQIFVILPNDEIEMQSRTKRSSKHWIEMETAKTWKKGLFADCELPE